jgi:predicted RecA/RadA family phage recombinase
MVKRKPIFRQVALERLSSPEQLDQLIRVTHPTGWAALFALGLLLLAAILWGLFGSIPTRVVGQGILLAPGGVNDVVSLASGQVVDIYFGVGDIIQAGQVVARIAEPDQPVNTKIVSPYAGHIVEVKVDDSSLVERGIPILSVEAGGEGPGSLEAVLYVPTTEGKKIRPGMDVQLSPSTVKREEFGFILGQVVSVGEFPATRQGMFRVLGSEELVQALSVGGALIEVHVDLILDAETPSGYAWSSSAGPPAQVDSGTFCTAWIEVREQRPLSLVLPAFK